MLNCPFKAPKPGRRGLRAKGWSFTTGWLPRAITISSPGFRTGDQL